MSYSSASLRLLDRKGVAFAAILLCLVSLQLSFAGTTGKIAGVIRDAETREPLPGANVTIEGTNMGDASDVNGAFSIIGVPPGEYTLVISMMGYSRTRFENVRVNIDMTTPVNVDMQPTVLEVGEEVTVVAERPIVQMDMTGSMASVGTEEIGALPVQSVGEVLELQAGVVNAGGIHIRGGRSGEVAYWVDGVATTDVFSGANRANIENTAIQELQVISGTFNAEYGQAMSGIINIITKDGGPEYHGEFRGYVGDYFSTHDVYQVLDRADVIVDSLSGETRQDVEKSYPLKDFNPIYNVEASLNGPVPFTKDKLTFFVNARYYERDGYLYGRRWFLPVGLPGDSALAPLNPGERFSGLGKLAWRVVPGMKLTYSLNHANWYSPRSFSRNYKYVPDGVNRNKGLTTTHLLTLSHAVSSNTFYELKVNRLYTESRSYLYDNPTARPYWKIKVQVPGDSLNPDGLIYDLDPEHNKADAALLDSLQFLGLVSPKDWYVDPNNWQGYVSHDSAKAPASYSFFRAGNNLGRSWRSTAYWITKFDITSQINSTNQLKAGLELRLHELELDNYTLQPARIPGRDEQVVPFKPEIPDISTVFHDRYTRTPREFSAYIQDKLELKDIIMNIGLRFDYFDANSVVPVDPQDPNIYDPFKDEHIYRNPSAPDSIRVEYTPDERREIMQKKVDPKMQLSPRLGIAYPITDKGVIHFSYGHFFQIPEFRYLYDSPDFKLNSGGGRTIIGNADLNPQRTTQYEIGLQQQIARDIGIDVTLFYRDVRDWVGTSPLIETVRPGVAYSIYENKDYSNVRGVTLKAEKRYTNNFFAKLDYTFQVAEGTYSNPDDAFHAINAEQEPRRSLIPLNWDQRHTLNLQLSYRYKSWMASLVGKYKTGLPYTPSFAKGARIGGTTFIGLRENSARRPNISQVDVYLTKQFKISALDITAFAYIYNLFDQKGEAAVYSDTGSAWYTTFPKENEVPLDVNRVGTVQDLYNRPEWLIAPREIQLGVAIGF